MLESEEVQAKPIKTLVFFNYLNIMAELNTRLDALEAEYLQISRSQELPPHLKRLRFDQSPPQNTNRNKARKQFVVIDSRKVINDLKDRIQNITTEISELKKLRPLSPIPEIRQALQENKLFDALNFADLALQKDPNCLNHADELVFPDTVNFLQLINKQIIDPRLFDTIDDSPIYHYHFEINFFTRVYLFTMESKAALQELLNHFQPMFHLVDRINEPLLHVAARLGCRRVVNWLIDSGTPVDLITEDGRTALMVASFHGHDELIRDLVKRKANVAHRSTNNQMSLLLASQSGFKTVVEFLIQNYTNPAVLKEDIDIAFYYACLGGYLPIMELLMDRNATVNFLYSNLSPLMVACQFNQIGAVRFLIECCRADIHQTDSNGNTALIVASDRDSPELIQLLLDSGANINHSNVVGRTALIKAANQGHRNVVALLHLRGATFQYVEGLPITAEGVRLIEEVQGEARVKSQGSTQKMM